MDKKTQEFLKKVGQSIPKELLKKALPTETNLKGKTRINPNQKGSSEIEKFFETKIKAAIARGEIKPPKEDEFTRKIREKTQ